MRDFVRFATVGRMRRLSLVALTLTLGCHPPEYYLYLEQQEQFASESSDSSDSIDSIDGTDRVRPRPHRVN